MNRDVVVIGGGVNGLTAACYMARAGKKVNVICPENELGELCGRHEFTPGFWSPGILNDTGMLRPWVVKDLKLQNHGLSYSDENHTLVLGKNDHLLLSDSIEDTAGEIARLSLKDSSRYKEMKEFYARVKAPVEKLLNNIPADLVDPKGTDIFSLLKRGFQLRRLGKKDMLEILRLAPMTVYDWLDEWFENDTLKAALACPAVTESYTAPWSPGTNANLLIQQTTRGASVKGDGLALVDVLLKAAKNLGVNFIDASVVKINPGEGVELADNTTVAAGTVIAACGPKKVFLEMMDAKFLGSTFEQRIRNFRTRGLCSQLLLALDKPPQVQGGATRVILADDLDGIEQSFDPIKYDALPQKPTLEVYLPSTDHDDLAPPGKAVASVLIHYTPYYLNGGWEAPVKEEFSDKVIDLLDQKIPGIKTTVEGKQFLCPVDIEQRYRVSGGQIYHGEHGLDQLLVRPSPECAQYATPFNGLYLCSGGSFPGGGLTAAPGALAAKKVLAD